MLDHNTVARFEALDTPFYYYDLELLQKTLASCKVASDKYGFHVHYAFKANFNERVLKAIQQIGFGADCVSGNEVKKAIEIGFDPGKVVFAGVGKSDREIIEGLENDIYCFNVESVQELGIINDLAAKRGKTARVAIRINPNVDAHTHHYITTGLEENKFGVNQWELKTCVEELRKSSNLQLIGIHFHIGSQITNLDIFKSLCVKANELSQWFEEHGFQLQILNVGGGFGVDYYNPDESPVNDFESYFEIFNKFLERKPNQEVHFELGRALVAQCGNLISRILYVKNGLKKNFLILDAGMTELMRPALYQAYHKIQNLSADKNAETVKYDVVGPICESTDWLGKEVELPLSKRGDLVVLRTAGAYGQVMASGYNLRDIVRSEYSS
ncbi:diaminopimelate decarboxylase [Daejeonella lutea]|uniref:Diaminopimelate decarboxylase n=1 Tax=Daejeonella lutea TaxID=572036 RepID=A0A1T5B6E2_9SPHI|nr:diaminopimelate decarboxylase [Daejeonella lutea]SKB42842.1 diaminopimelate decarboxylase [Daejeonella lutea]